MSEGSAYEVPITRETFIEDLEYIGATKAPRMVPRADESEGEVESIEDAEGSIKFIEVPEIIRKTGIIPDGYKVDLALDPIIVVAALKKRGLVYMSQLPPGMVEEMRNTIMAPDNMTIIPTEIWEGKYAAMVSGIERTEAEEAQD